MRKRVTVAVATVLALAVILMLFLNRDTRARREYVHGQIAKIAAQARDNPSDPRYARELVEIANSDYGFAATLATAALGDIGEAARPVIHDLAALLNSPDMFVQREAALSLAELGRISEPALAALAEKVAVGDPGQDATWFAARAIGNICPEGKQHLPLLRIRLGDNRMFDESLREAIEQLESCEGGGAEVESPSGPMGMEDNADSRLRERTSEGANVRPVARRVRIDASICRG